MLVARTHEGATTIMSVEQAVADIMARNGFKEEDVRERLKKGLVVATDTLGEYAPVHDWRLPSLDVERLRGENIFMIVADVASMIRAYRRLAESKHTRAMYDALAESLMDRVNRTQSYDEALEVVKDYVSAPRPDRRGQ